MSFKSSCYKFYNIKKTWEEAKRSCELEAGSTLATINDDKEDHFLTVSMRSLSSPQFWIGLNDQEYEDMFEWLDKSKVEYTNWTCPTCNEENFDCVMSSEYGWINEECGEVAEFVCEYRPCKFCKLVQFDVPYQYDTLQHKTMSRCDYIAVNSARWRHINVQCSSERCGTSPNFYCNLLRHTAMQYSPTNYITVLSTAQ